MAETYGLESESILQTAKLWKKNVSVILGPQETCNHEARYYSSAYYIIVCIVLIYIYIYIYIKQKLESYDDDDDDDGDGDDCGDDCDDDYDDNDH